VKYIEFCAGIGGTRAGLDAAGWQCVLAVDHDPDAVAVHSLAHGPALEADVTKLTAHDLPVADAWVAGFPCQPFSSSGNRLGFGHGSGNVFGHLARLMDEKRPSIVILENVEGLLSNKSGHTFATILSSLTQIGYNVDWVVLDLRWFRVPQSRRRLFLVAARPGALHPPNLPESSGLLPGIAQSTPSVFATFLVEYGISWSRRAEGSISAWIDRLEPKVGKARYGGPKIFSGLGHATQESFISYDLSTTPLLPEPRSLASIVSPDFCYPDVIRSARYWSPNGGGGVAGLHIRDEPLAHCVGTSLGGAPLFAVPLSTVTERRNYDAFIAFANWYREQGGLLVMRLRPERAVMLFGPHTKSLSDALAEWHAGATRKFRLVGNMVAPICVEHIAALVDAQLTVSRGVKVRQRRGEFRGKALQVASVDVKNMPHGSLSDS
jgi:hypothetical protein